MKKTALLFRLRRLGYVPLVTVSLYGVPLHSEETAGGPSAPYVTKNPTLTTPPPPPAAAKPPPATVGVEATGTGSGMPSLDAASQNADQASNDQSKGSGKNDAMSGIMQGVSGAMSAAAAACFAAENPGCGASNTKLAVFFAIQAALAAAQAAMQGGTSDGNNTAAGNFKSFDGLGSSNGAGGKKATASGSGTTPDKTSGANGNSYSQLTGPGQETLRKLAEAGYKVDLENKTVTTPDGTTVSAADAKNAKTMEAKLGLAPGEYQKNVDLMNQILKEKGLLNGGGGVDGHGGSVAGASDGEGSGAGGGYDGSGGKSNAANAAGAGRTPASNLVAGLSTSYRGDRIGVAADDIFQMVNRRYNTKTQQDSFITLDRPEKGVWAPPSVAK